MTDEQCDKICSRISISLGMLALTLVIGIGLGMLGISINIHGVADKIACQN